MCRRIQCEHCLKPTFSGCGKHVEQVLRGIADQDRCVCSAAFVAQTFVAQHAEHSRPVLQLQAAAK